jgi:hypothetical protein
MLLRHLNRVMDYETWSHLFVGMNNSEPDDCILC